MDFAGVARVGAARGRVVALVTDAVRGDSRVQWAVRPPAGAGPGAAPAARLPGAGAGAVVTGSDSLAGMLRERHGPAGRPTGRSGAGRKSLSGGDVA